MYHNCNMQYSLYPLVAMFIITALKLPTQNTNIFHIHYTKIFIYVHKTSHDYSLYIAMYNILRYIIIGK